MPFIFFGSFYPEYFAYIYDTKEFILKKILTTNQDDNVKTMSILVVNGNFLLNLYLVWFTDVQLLLHGRCPLLQASF
jgi:hypothetical protein